MKSRQNLIIRKARENNLKDLSLELPHDTLVGITGLSGSGKSSLAFDTIYAEGQRRYIETFSPYTRQFFDKVKRPKVDLLDNVRPAIAIQQRTRILNSRSTVGSMTDINDFLKIVWANVSQPVCPQCSLELKRWDPPALAQHLERLSAVRQDSTFLVGLLVKNAKDSLARLQTLGYSRYFDTDTAELLDLEEKKPAKRLKDVVIVVDRFRATNFQAPRIRESLEQCFSLGNGSLHIVEVREKQTKPLMRLSAISQPKVVHRGYETYIFKTTYQCGDGEVSVERPRPALFSYNHPIGACPECNGFGRILVIDPHKCIPDHSKTITQYAVDCWRGNAAKGEHRALLAFCRETGIPIDRPWSELEPAQQREIFTHRSRKFAGIDAWFKYLEGKKYKMHVRVFLARYRGQVVCPTCRGSRLKADALAYRINGRTIAEIACMTLSDLFSWFTDLHAALHAEKKMARELDDVIKNILSRLRYLVNLGLPYLSLDRLSRTLSGGETQRVNLVSAVGSNLISTHFVLDEPSVGLHARDTEALIGALHDLTDRGNSLTIVEHDPECLRAADSIVELGPEAGERGGSVTFCGPQEKWPGLQIEPFQANDTPPRSLKKISIAGAHSRNLKSISVEIPLEAFVCLTGVSGSGKSSLVTEVIQAGYDRFKGVISGEPEQYAAISGFEHVGQVLLVDQSPLSKTPRANIATYTKMWDRVRDLLAATDDAKTRGLSKSSFSFNVAAGRCPVCEGAGYIKEDMQFLSDVYIQCEACLGMRFQSPVLEVKLNGKNVHEILSMSVEACGAFFERDLFIASVCRILSQLGLGHITVGHSLSDLSGGEAQRLKLVPHIVEGTRNRSLFLFDEPTTGLHVHDIERLLKLFKFLVAQGHSILCIEHNLRLIAEADWLIDLGPEGGVFGGEVIKTGTPADFIKDEIGLHGHTSLTARYLAEFIDQYSAKQKNKSARRKAPLKAPRRKRQPVDAVRIEGAREHNLKNISLSVPLNKIITLTGVSGSGKSTIAKDILYAEGQRRYLDCLSPYARQFIKELKKPAIDDISNVQPTICVYQHTFQPSALSTVATMSEVYNFLRLLYAKIGMQFCPDHPEQSISPLSADQIAAHIKQHYSGTIRLLAPVITMKKGHHRNVFQRAIDSEISEVRVDGVFSQPSKFIDEGLQKTKIHSIEFVTARFNVKNLPTDLITEGVTQGLTIGGGTVVVASEDGDRVFSSERTCQICQRGFFKPDPEDLSFNSRRGRCSKCDGYGVVREKVCPECNGTRINAIGRNIRLFNKNIHELTLLPAPALQSLLAQLHRDQATRDIAEPIVRELVGKLMTLIDLGLEHLSLNRECATLSNGELQRLRLATAIGSPLSGVTYIFDEPSAGLHPADNKRLLSKLVDLKDRGNTVIQIEHEIDNILAAEHIIDVGPGAGTQGGEIVYEGDVTAAYKHAKRSATARALCTPLSFREPTNQSGGDTLQITGARKNNLRAINVTIPLKSLVTVAGVSGSGKSSLVHGVIGDALTTGIAAKSNYKGAFGSVKSSCDIERTLIVDQQPIGKTSRSTPASYLGIWDEIRKVFAGTLEAKSRGWGPSFFSHNTGKGRCPTCKGNGELTLEMSFLAEAKVLCESCMGSRFTPEADSVKYRELSVSKALKLTFEEARTFFINHRKIHQVCKLACDLGLGYLTLGQQSSTLSGGESQRLKLVSELHLSRKGHTLYILDEPTTGLHRTDVELLLKGLHALTAQGHSVLVIEHDADTITQSDWVIELGPGAGELGGTVIFEGPAEGLLKQNTPWSTALAERMTIHASCGAEQAA
jgi:excinuclease ABC subunit A